VPPTFRLAAVQAAPVVLDFDATVEKAVALGDFEEMPWLAGQGVAQVRAVRPAAQIVDQMMTEAAAVVGALAA
jgi:NAD(P)H-dependent flavin oxidoreductase YrpB (nitropropane dioxygenase family)